MAATDLVGKEPAQARPDGHPDKTDRSDPTSRRLVQVPVHRERRDNEGDQPHVHRIQCPSDAGTNQQFLVLAGDRKAVEALCPGQARCIRGVHASHYRADQAKKTSQNQNWSDQRSSLYRYG